MKTPRPNPDAPGRKRRPGGGRPRAFLVSRDPSSYQPAEGPRWRELLPRYGRLWELLYRNGGSIHALTRRLRVTADGLRAMLNYLETLGALSLTEVKGQTHITLHRLPSIVDFDPVKSEEAGAPSPWHGNQLADVEAFRVFVSYSRLYAASAGRTYTVKRAHDELEQVRQLLWRYGVTLDDLITAAGAFLAEARALGDLTKFTPGGKRSEETRTGLKLLRYAKYRRYGPTLTTLCMLYADIAGQLRGLDRDDPAFKLKAARGVKHVVRAQRARAELARAQPELMAALDERLGRPLASRKDGKS